jgi:hypothetical protein
MPIVASREDRLASPARSPGQRERQATFSYAGSIAIHALCAVLMVVGLALHLPPPDEITGAIEVVIEPVPSVPPAAPQAASGDANAWAKFAWDSRPPADAERQGKGTADARTIDGRGTDKVATLAPRSAAEQKDSADLSNDPQKEIVRIVPPRTDTRSRRETAAPRGLEGAAWAPDGVKQDDTETTAEQQPIQCGPNGKVKIPRSQYLMRGRVLAALAESETGPIVKSNERNYDLWFSPAYVAKPKVRVQVEPGAYFPVVDGTRLGPYLIVTLPDGLNVQTGDTLEFTFHHLDPARPCHFIPNSATRVVPGPQAGPGFGAFSFPPAFGSAPPAFGSARR